MEENTVTPYPPQAHATPTPYPSFAATRPTWSESAAQPVSQAELAVMHPEDNTGDRHDPDWRYYHAATVR